MLIPKLRPYYRRLAEIHAHYLEVEALLAGEMASTIAKSFEASKHHPRSRPSRLDLNADHSQSPARKDLPRSGNGQSDRENEVDIGDSEEASETTGLLGISEKEDKRERIAKIALNGKSPRGIVADRQ